MNDTNMNNRKRDLTGTVALVAGATRGAGRAIAIALGERGATVYCSGRSTRVSAPGPLWPGATSSQRRPEVIEDTASLVDAAGGVGRWMRCDHQRDDDIVALVERIRAEEGGLDVLVNDLWGGESLIEFGVPFWKADPQKGRAMVENAVLTHMLTARYATPLLLDRRREHGKKGLIVEVTDGDSFGYRGMFFYDVVKMALVRCAFAMAKDLRDEDVAAVAVTPGFLRSEEMLAHFGVGEDNWRDAVKDVPDFIASETPRYVGRCIAALAADPAVQQKSGRVYASWTLAKEYDVVDADGARPDWGAYFEKTYGPIPAADYASWDYGPVDAVVATEQKKRRRRRRHLRRHLRRRRARRPARQRRPLPLNRCGRPVVDAAGATRKPCRQVPTRVGGPAANAPSGVISHRHHASGQRPGGNVVSTWPPLQKASATESPSGDLPAPSATLSPTTAQTQPPRPRTAPSEKRGAG